MKRKTISIGAEFGSKFQEEFAGNSLLIALKAWQSFLIGQHKKNKISVEVGDGNFLQDIDSFEWEDDKKSSKNEEFFMKTMEGMGVKFVDMVATEDDELVNACVDCGKEVDDNKTAQCGTCRLEL